MSEPTSNTDPEASADAEGQPEADLGPWSDVPLSELWGRLALLAAVICGAGTGFVSLLWEADVLTATVRAASAFLTLVLLGRLGRWLLRTLESSGAEAVEVETPEEAPSSTKEPEKEAA